MHSKKIKERGSKYYQQTTDQVAFDLYVSVMNTEIMSCQCHESRSKIMLSASVYCHGNWCLLM